MEDTAGTVAAAVDTADTAPAVVGTAGTAAPAVAGIAADTAVDTERSHHCKQQALTRTMLHLKSSSFFSFFYIYILNVILYIHICFILVLVVLFEEKE